MANFDKALNTLEYNKILNMLSDCALTEGAKALVARLMPSDDLDRVIKLQSQTTDAKKLATIKGMPSFGFIKDVNASLERADKSAVLSMRELLDIAAVLYTTRRLLDYINTDKRFTTSIDVNFDRLTANRPLEERITRAIIAEDMIADEASLALADIRRKIRNAGNKVKDNLQKFVSGSTYSKYLQDNIITMRNGRYVVPVKSEYKNEISGLIHDTSSSGATVFIEPLSVVEANNELREYQSKEAHEIERILAELSAACAESSNLISLDYYNITEIAFIFAKVELSFKLEASQPHISAGRTIELYNARHPMLDPKKVVPIHISLGGTFDTLVITGPNTGGKTVTLKTLGLLSMMAQSGLHIPADDISTICIFDEILADIGDEQSIEQSLSTFSAHMVNIVNITHSAGENSLVLFDELGAGTDPIEGAALAEAILENIRSKGSLCAATTHYAELKAYALETDGVSNASCEFDIETLKPTYRLIIGTPGKSNAFAISEKLGLDSQIIEAAQKFVSGDNKRFEYVIEQLDQRRIEMEQQRDATAKIKREYELFKAESETKLREKIEATEKELEKSRAQAVRLVEGARVSSEYVFDQLAQLKKQRDSEHLSSELETARDIIRKKLRGTETSVNTVNEHSKENYVLPRPLKVGDDIILININQRGIVTSVPDKDGNVSVQAGIINTKTNISNIMLADDEKVIFINKDKKKMNTSDYKISVTKSFKPELDLRGMNGEEAWFMTDKYLDDAKVAGMNSVTLVHGKGTGALKTALWRFLKSDTRIKSYRLGQYGEGDLGVTVVEIK